MSDSVTTQADIGSLGLSGLGAFTTILSAMSKDNVQPVAMLLLENLGSLFLINGPYAERVPEVLKRVVNHPVGRLSLAVGWRRGDSISEFAQTAGGQSITLLATCLANIYKEHDYGLILSRLCVSLLPKSLPRSSPKQVGDIAKLIAAKTGQLSFGNLLAQQARRILSVYQHLDTNPPTQLFEIPATDSMIQLCESLTNLKSKNHVIRISGSIGILYTTAIIMFMFPGCTMLTVESVVIHNNEDSRIIIEVCEAPTKVQVETGFGPHQVLVTTPLEPLRRNPLWQNRVISSLHWDGWLTEALFLRLANFGVMVTEELREAIFEFMVQVTPHLRLRDFCMTDGGLIPGPAPKKYWREKKFKDLLGPHHQYKVASTCRTICHYEPCKFIPNPVEQWQRLLRILEQDLEHIKCCCGDCTYLTQAWHAGRDCPRWTVFRVIGSALSSGIICCLIEPQGSVTIPGLFKVIMQGPALISVLEGLGLECANLPKEPNSWFQPYAFYRSIVEMASHPIDYNVANRLIGLSSGGCSIYPKVLGSFGVEPDGSFGFIITEGMFVYNESYHEYLSAEERGHRDELYARPAAELAPLSIFDLAEPFSLTPSLREGYGVILLRLNVLVTGLYFDVSASEAVASLLFLEATQSCEHSLDDSLHEEYAGKASVGSVGMAPSPGHDMNIIMTRKNRQAQFAACGFGWAPAGHLLLKCCLNCGVRQALEKNFRTLLVA